MRCVYNSAEFSHDWRKNEPEFIAFNALLWLYEKVVHQKICAIFPVKISRNKLFDPHKFFPWNELKIVYWIEIKSKKDSVGNVWFICFEAPVFFPENKQDDRLALLL